MATAPLDRIEQRRVLGELSRTLSQEAHTLRTSPALTWQQLYGNWLQFAEEPMVSVLQPEHERRSAENAGLWLRRLQPPPTSSTLVAVLADHTGSINACCFSPDGTRLATASSDGTTRLWDAQSRQPLAVLRGTPADFSPDGTILATSDSPNDPTVRLWDGHSGAPLTVLSAFTREVDFCAFAPSGAVLVTGLQNSGVESAGPFFWDARALTPLSRLDGYVERARAYAFSPDGASFVMVGGDGGTRSFPGHGWGRLFDGQTGQPVATLEGFTNDVRACAFSPNGTVLVTAGAEKVVRVWDARTGAALTAFDGHTSTVMACAFSPDGAVLATAGYGSTVYLWDPKTWAQLDLLESPATSLYSCAFSPDGSILAAGDGGRTMGMGNGPIYLWEWRSRRRLADLVGHAAAVDKLRFSPDGRLLATATTPFQGDDFSVRLWDVSSRATLRRSATSLREQYIEGICYRPDGSQIITLGTSARQWSAQQEAPTLLAEMPNLSVVPGGAFSPDGAALLTIHGDQAARLWRAGTDELLATMAGHTDTIVACAFSPRGDVVATGSWDRTAQLWDAGTGAPLGTLEGHTESVNSCAFSPDGRLLATASRDRTVRIWDVEARGPLTLVEGHTQDIESTRFSPDGQRLVTASRGPRRIRDDAEAYAFAMDQPAILWDLTTGAGTVLSGHVGRVWACEFSPDGRRLVTSSSEGNTPRLWDGQTGGIVANLVGHTAPVLVCRFTADGQLLATVSRDSTLRLWDPATGVPLYDVPLEREPRSLAAHPWRPILAIGDSYGFTELLVEGFAAGPVVVTAVDRGDGPHVLCPECQQRWPVTNEHIGMVMRCLTPACTVRLRLNSFVTVISPRLTVTTSPAPKPQRPARQPAPVSPPPPVPAPVPVPTREVASDRSPWRAEAAGVPRPRTASQPRPPTRNRAAFAGRVLTGVGIVAGLIALRGLAGLIGPDGYGTALGALLLAGVVVLTWITMLSVSVIGSMAFHEVQGGPIDAVASWTLLISVGLIVVLVGRAIGLAVGWLPAGELPPTWLAWLFT